MELVLEHVVTSVLENKNKIFVMIKLVWLLTRRLQDK